MTDTIKEALEVAESWSSAFTQSDTDKLMSLFAPDAVFIGTTNKAVVTGTDGIRHYFESNLVQTKRYCLLRPIGRNWARCSSLSAGRTG